MISRENIDRVRAAASFSFLPPIPSFLPNAFWQWQQWQRPHGWLVMWALEWRRPAFGSSGTHFLLCPDCKGRGDGTRFGYHAYSTDSAIRFKLGAVPICLRCEGTGLVLAGHGGRSPIP